MIYLLKHFFINFYKAIIDLMFPEFCVGCNKLNTLLCSRCFEELEFLQFKIDKNKTKYLNSINCCCYYNSVAKKLVHELKYKYVKDVGKTIAHIMYYAMDYKKIDLITFVPIHKMKEDQRGFNQSEIIATQLSKLLNVPIAQLLIKTKETKSQMSVGNKKDREKNILGSISINKLVDKQSKDAYKSILIVDDVFTTGVTLNYCAKILKDFGFKNIHGCCFLFRN